MARPRTITDERLLAATAAVIERTGPGFTLAQVAREAGVAVGSVAQRFGSKSGLLRALTEAGRVQAVERMRSAAEAADSPESAVRAALLAVFAGLDSGGDSGVTNHLAQLGTDLADPQLRGLLGLHYAALRQELSGLLRVAGTADEWRGPEPDVAARVLLSAVNGAALDWSLLPGGGADSDDADSNGAGSNDAGSNGAGSNHAASSHPEAVPPEAAATADTGGRPALRDCLAETIDVIMKGWLP
ncbi:transcriptional regulator, TetR family [Prauserella aidingensis]|uniref:TetR/AcrR family transcriptional regulator n=1 Tax=Prauserella aidingensis TaxID=387890 RepID=UPI0020A2BB25|nr:TetR/AcrR family transcriptional regulator [Prauserella aidingensis]MCP2255113.1 transcriptional regulator, TetR family [Prauserella aidingensis]